MKQMKFLQKNHEDVFFGNYFNFYDRISLSVSDYFYKAFKKNLIRKLLRIYTKYNTYVYNISKQKTLVFLLRHFFQLMPMYYNLLPIFQFVKQVHLRDTLFYSGVEDSLESIFFTLPKKFFFSSKFKNSFFSSFHKDPFGGANFFFVDYSILNQPYDLKKKLITTVNLNKDCALLKSVECFYFSKHYISVYSNNSVFILYLLLLKHYYYFFIYQVLKNLNNKYI